MAKRKRGFTENKYNKFIKEGRGQGRGKDYKPGLTIQNVPSKGRSTREKGIKSGRRHEFLSDNERNYFHIIEFSKCVKDIREQFPLLPREFTQSIADEIGVKHPTDPGTNEHIVMTTDFLITIEQNGKLIDYARTIKSSNELNDKRKIEKFEIERRYWEMEGVNWGIVTENEIDGTFAQNVMDVYKFHRLDDKIGFSKFNADELSKLIVNYVSRLSNDESIRQISDRFDNEMMLLHGSGLSIFKHLVINHLIEVNMREKINVDNPIDIRVNFTREKLMRKDI